LNPPAKLEEPANNAAHHGAFRFCLSDSGFDDRRDSHSAPRKANAAPSATREARASCYAWLRGVALLSDPASCAGRCRGERPKLGERNPSTRIIGPCSTQTSHGAYAIHNGNLGTMQVDFHSWIIFVASRVESLTRVPGRHQALLPSK
jgi:hypothetical protein